MVSIYRLKHLYTGQITQFSNLLVDDLYVLCIHVSSSLSFLFLEKRVILKTVCFRVSSQKEVWTRPHQLCLPLLMQTSLIFSQQILHPQTTPHAFKPHARACRTPTQFLAKKTPCKWAATQLWLYWKCTQLRERVNHFISKPQQPKDALAMSSMNIHSAVCRKGDKPLRIAWCNSQGILCKRDGFDFVDVNPMLREEDKDCRTAWASGQKRKAHKYCPKRPEIK